MLTDEHVEHHRTFGFVVLRRQLDEATVAALSDEVDRALRAAFGDRFDERPDEGGISGHYLPVMSAARTPVSLRLVERFHGIARRLLGAEPLPAPAEAMASITAATWVVGTKTAYLSVSLSRGAGSRKRLGPRPRRSAISPFVPSATMSTLVWAATSATRPRTRLATKAAVGEDSSRDLSGANISG